MGFISFNKSYYKNKIEIYENKVLTAADIYDIQQLLKVLDDLSSEGYTNLNNQMEGDFQCLTRLRALLSNAGAVPFETIRENSKRPFGLKEYELSSILDRLIDEANDINLDTKNQFVLSVKSFAKWIGYDNDTAYIFLLRDTLLPYVFFKSAFGSNVYPWLISRKFIENVTGLEGVDDDIRLPIYEALERGYVEFNDCFAFCKERILTVLDKHSKLKNILNSLLSSIKQSRIVVIESGYMGTIPMMLKAIDSRVQFKLYTTAPFLYKTYSSQIYCSRYEDVRKFETIYSHSSLLSYSSFCDGEFYVNITNNKNVKNKALTEIKLFIEN